MAATSRTKRRIAFLSLLVFLFLVKGPELPAISVASESHGRWVSTSALADIKKAANENVDSIAELKELLQHGNGSKNDIPSLLGSINDRQLFLAKRLADLVASNVTETVLHPPVLYGHIHMAKTGGTSLNGILANSFERVCGHKGYSYDAYADNERAKKKKDAGEAVRLEWGRSRVMPPEMEMTGYEDCDYVSHEMEWSFWKTKFGGKRFHGLEMELHVPCRSPIDHLMSQCNYLSKSLKCGGISDKEFFQAIKSCIVHQDRFEKDLLNHFTVKCFDFQKQFTTYVDHMAEILQRRRFESTPYVERETNRPRNKMSECIWNDREAHAKAEQYLRETYDYYRFCDECMGSADEITGN